MGHLQPRSNCSLCGSDVGLRGHSKSVGTWGARGFAAGLQDVHGAYICVLLPIVFGVVSCTCQTLYTADSDLSQNYRGRGLIVIEVEYLSSVWIYRSSHYPRAVVSSAFESIKKNEVSWRKQPPPSMHSLYDRMLRFI